MEYRTNLLNYVINSKYNLVIGRKEGDRMLSLKKMIDNNMSLSEGLKQNGEQHRNYDMYTSMERALGVLLNGEIFLTNGARWNDVNDRYLMDIKKAYALCLSCSTKENIAMWMLYGAEHGKKGAMLRLYPSIMKELIAVDTVELGNFKKDGKFSVGYVLHRVCWRIRMYFTKTMPGPMKKNADM